MHPTSYNLAAHEAEKYPVSYDARRDFRNNL